MMPSKRRPSKTDVARARKGANDVAEWIRTEEVVWIAAINWVREQLEIAGDLRHLGVLSAPVVAREWGCSRSAARSELLRLAELGLIEHPTPNLFYLRRTGE